MVTSILGTLALCGSAKADEPSDLARFPTMMHFLKTVVTDHTEPPPAGNEHLMHATKVFHTNQEMWEKFFQAAVADKLTNLRAFGLLSREIKARGITVYGPGAGFEQAVRDNHVDLGLAIPAKNVGLGVWEPDSTITDPEFSVHLSVIYKERFIHQFPDEVMPANLRIGTGDQTDYYIDGERHRGYLLTADLYYGPHGIGFKNVHGVGGEKRGVLGFLQKMLFFLPDAISSMVIDEQKNVMLTEAIINTTVENFETRDIYRIRYRN
ncbi:MAG: hypothetical protein HY074_15175 [Deltaproteobacteria bacterium]|nr:hypothetical protein [Deltaproteobacteria bacterium]